MRHFSDASKARNSSRGLTVHVQVRTNVFKEVMKTNRKQIGLWTGLRSTWADPKEA